MEKRDWSRNLELGLKDVDGEHRLQIDLVDALEDALRRGEERELAAGILERLLDYTNAHFHAEELMMRFHSYPSYDAHVAEHAELSGHLRELREVHEQGQLPVTLELVDALKGWLAGHIRTMDRGFAGWVKRSGSEP